MVSLSQVSKSVLQFCFCVVLHVQLTRLMTSGTVQNFVGVHPTPSSTDSTAADEDSAQMVEEFAHFDPRIVRLLRYEFFFPIV